MPQLAPMAERQGTFTSQTFQIAPAWSGRKVVLEIPIDPAYNVAGKMLEMAIEWANDDQSNPGNPDGNWRRYVAFKWEGGSPPGKDGTFHPRRAWTLPPAAVGRHLRGRIRAVEPVMFSAEVRLE